MKVMTLLIRSKNPTLYGFSCTQALIITGVVIRLTDEPLETREHLSRVGCLLVVRFDLRSRQREILVRVPTWAPEPENGDPIPSLSGVAPDKGAWMSLARVS